MAEGDVVSKFSNVIAYLSSIYKKAEGENRKYKNSKHKVFKNVLVQDIPKMMVLPGTNGSGKSTFFYVFGFLSDALQNNVTSATERYKQSGFEELKQVIQKLHLCGEKKTKKRENVIFGVREKANNYGYPKFENRSYTLAN